MPRTNHRTHASQQGPAVQATSPAGRPAALPRLDGNPFIIVGRENGAPRSDLKGPWAAVTRAAGLDGLRIHDLRHSFASVAAGASLGLPVIGKLLGHSQAATAPDTRI